jgi:hypothetical protein
LPWQALENPPKSPFSKGGLCRSLLMDTLFLSFK